MRYRRRNKIIIGILCSTLIFMGIGYALMNSVLRITSTANVTGDFNIHFLNDNQNKKGITLIDYENSTQQNTVYNTSVTAKAIQMESGTGVGTDPTTATFSAIFQNPSDYATFTATVKNYGTIKGRISSVDIVSTPSQQLSDWLSNNGTQWSDYFEITTTAAVDTVINPDAEYEFTITVTFKSGAELLPQGALNNTITITYVQDNGQAVIPQVVYVDQDDSCFVSFVDGEINYYDTSKQGCGSSVTIPNNLRLKISTVTGYTFNSQLCGYFAPNLKQLMGYGNEVSNEQMCSELESTIAGLYNTGQEALFSTFYAAFVIPTYSAPSGAYNPVTKVGAGSFVARNLSSLTLSSNITELKDASFTGNGLTTLTIPNSVTSIGNFAFIQNALTSINWGSGLVSIGESAFNGNQLTTLNFAAATSLETIGKYAFEYNQLTGTLVITSSIETIDKGAFQTVTKGTYNQITGLDLSNATNLTTIEESAFMKNGLTSLTIPSSVETIGGYAFHGNLLASINLSGATNLQSIGSYAFSLQINANSNHVLQSINASNKTKAQYDTISNNQTWYDNDNANFHITYSDVTCDKNGTCTAN